MNGLHPRVHGVSRPRTGQVRFAAVIALLGLLPLLLVACGKSTAAQSDAVRALRKLAAFKSGEAALVFVYADG